MDGLAVRGSRRDDAVLTDREAMGGPLEQGPMYMRAFLDLDGHRWSLIHFDMSAMSEQ